MILSGTSGYSYPSWKGRFYPKTLAATGMLAYYAERLPAVEINNTFYKRPTKEQLESWASQTPPTFELAFKASRYFSAGTGLRDHKAVADFFALMAHVKTRLGPVLVALPPHVKKDVAMLSDFLDAAKGHKIAFELADPSWDADDARDVLARHDAALCVTEDDDHTPVLAKTASWGYVRLRKTRYDARALATWRARIEGAGFARAYVFFKHEDTGPSNALALLGKSGKR